LTGIPCSHAISCLRHERVPVESVIPDCYSTTTYLIAYGQNIWPCKDNTELEKVSAIEIHPPVYEKKVGRPPKYRRKQSCEIQGPNGPRLSKHGIIMTCTYCGETGHSKRGCALGKVGTRPKIVPKRTACVINAEDEPGPSHMEYDEPIAAQVMTSYTFV